MAKNDKIASTIAKLCIWANLAHFDYVTCKIDRLSIISILLLLYLLYHIQSISMYLFLRLLRQARYRNPLQAQFSHTLAVSPDGNYEFLTYNTAFVHKAQATEIVTLTKESGHWQVSGYHFR